MPSTASQPNARPSVPPRRSGVITPNHATWQQRLIATVTTWLIRIVASSLRWRMHDPQNHLTAGGSRPVIFAIWHNRLALSLVLYQRYVQRHEPDRRMAAMVSASRDGALLARILELFDVAPVRGSSSRRGPQALRELVTWAERGYDLAITPDGPRGPRYQVQEGVIAVAQLTGLPIVPASYRLSWKIRVKSWDRFQIPIPGSRCELRVAPPISIRREASPQQREDARRQLETTLRELTGDQD